MPYNLTSGNNMILTTLINYYDCSINLCFQSSSRFEVVKIMDFKLKFDLAVKGLSFRLLMIFVLILI